MDTTRRGFVGGASALALLSGSSAAFAQQDLDLIAYFDLVRIFKFRHRDYALGLVADIYEHFAGPNFQDPSFNDTAFFEIAQGLRD